MAASTAASVLPKIMDVAVSAARQAGSRMLAAINTASAAVEATKSSHQDLVTATDKACQEDIETAVRAAFGEAGADGSGHHFLGEEDVAAGSEASSAAVEAMEAAEWLWVVDPIDGTTNFIHGVPLSVVSVAVAHRGELQVGVIYDPFRDELFAAKRGEGATLNGSSISVSSLETSLDQAFLFFGTHTQRSVREPVLRAVGSLIGDTRAVRSLGSACLHLAWIAAGRGTAFWELDLNSWDLAAGALLVQESGGRVTDTRGNPYTLRTRDILASNGCDDIHDGIVERLTANGWDAPASA